MACSGCKKAKSTPKAQTAKTYTVPKPKQSSGTNYVYMNNKKYVYKQQ